MFIGFHELTVDDKNRLSIPSIYRAAVDPQGYGALFYLAPGEREHTLELFPKDYFSGYVERLQATLTDSPEADDFELFFLSMCALLEIDKAGRALLPQYQLQLAGIGRQVVLAGRGDRLVLCNRDEGHSFNTQTWSKYRALKQKARKGASAPGNAGAGGPEVRS
jgi:MraZ protein